MLIYKMNIRNGLKYILLTFVIAAVMVSCVHSDTWAGELVIPGTGACEEVLRELAFAYNYENPGHEIIIPKSTGSIGGIRKLISGQALLIRVARDLRPDEKGNDLIMIPFARDAVVFATGSNSGIDDISSAELGGVFSGRIYNWNILGSKSAPVLLVVRDNSETNLGILRSSFTSFKAVTFPEKSKVVYHDHAMIEMLEKYSTAIGFGTASNFRGKSVTVLSVDGVMHDDPQYPANIEYSLMYRRGDLPGIASDFIDFIFFEEGIKILKNYGLVPIARSAVSGKR